MYNDNGLLGQFSVIPAGRFFLPHMPLATYFPYNPLPIRLSPFPPGHINDIAPAPY
ncbi:hypothetical protein PEC301879_32680 [Pectobacterium carotovorum subsp. carotovorum]|nr:hypothetical protein PEC301879_32680 [Pectobacterium carotovorum subsp. carotovorum]